MTVLLSSSYFPATPTGVAEHSRLHRLYTPPNMSSGRCLPAAAPLNRPFSLTPPPPTSRLLPYSAASSSSSPSSYHSSHISRWAGQPSSAPFSSTAAPDSSSSFSSLSPLSPSVLKPRSSSSAASSSSSSSSSFVHSSSALTVSARSYVLWAGLLTFSLLLSLLFIVHLSAHAAPLSDAALPLPLPAAAAAAGLIRVAPGSLHGPASPLQPQLLFSRSVAARQLESFADRKKRKDAIAVEEQVEQDMRRMRKISDGLKAERAARQSKADKPTAAPVAVAAAVEQLDVSARAAEQHKAQPAVQLRGAAAAAPAAASTREAQSAAPH